MIVSHQKRFIMLLPWKTASQSMALRLQPFRDNPEEFCFQFSPYLQRVTHQHLTCADFACCPESKLGYFIGSFVRNPYDRVYSGFRQLQKDLAAQPGMAFPEPWIRELVMRQLADNFIQLSQAGCNFDRWVASITDEQVYEIGRNTSFLLHPAHYWTHLNGEPMVDFIGRVESFEHDFSEFLRQVNIPETPKVNANVVELEGGTHAHGYRYVDRMSAESIEKINRLFASDFELFDYPKLDPATHQIATRRKAKRPGGNAEEFTGERLVSSLPAGRRISTEHLHRYAVAAELCGSLRVLDLASGEGYGSALLSQQAANVCGVDISPEAVALAAAKYLRPNLTFLQGSALAIPLAEASVDLVVSYETIEHLEDHDRFLREIRRVLVPGGLLLVSTPNKAEFSGRTGISNPFHLRELDTAEFRNLLHASFQNVQLAGQRYVTGSWLESDTPPASSTHGVFTADYQSMPFVPGAAEPIFWLAVCSDGPLPALPLGMCLPPRPALDAWLETIENIPSPQPLLELVKTAAVLAMQPRLAEQMQKARMALEKQQARAEKWKKRAEALEMKLKQRKGKARKLFRWFLQK